MLKRKFGNRGPWIYNGVQIDMYKLAQWLYRYNAKTGQNVTPTTVTEDHIKAFLDG